MELLAFQLLAWAHLSQKEQLEVKNTVDAVLPFGTTGIVDGLHRLATSDGALGQAFMDAPRRAQGAGGFVIGALSTANALVKNGIFDRFDPGAIASELRSNVSGLAPLHPGVVDLMIDLTTGTEQSSVYCPWEATGQFIGALMKSDLRLHCESPGMSPVPALLSLLREAPTELVLVEPLRSPSAVNGGRLERFDASLSFPPIGAPLQNDIVEFDLYSRFPVKKASSTGLMVQHILAQTCGAAAIVVPNSFLSAPGRDRDLRLRLLKEGNVEAVIALPTRAIKGTSISAAILVLNADLNHSRVAFIDATKSYFGNEDKKGAGEASTISEYCRAVLRGEDDKAAALLDPTRAVTVPVEQLLENDGSLQVERYVLGQGQLDARALLKTTATVRLEDVVAFYNPIPNKQRKSDVPGAIRVYEVGAADLPPAGYIASPEKVVALDPQVGASRREGLFLRPRDVVLITKGSVGKIGIVPDNVPPPGGGGWIAGQSAVVLRVTDPNRDIRGLALWLRSSMGQEILGGLVSGTTIPMISVRLLRALEVPEFSLERSRQAGGIVDSEAAIQHQIDELKGKQRELAMSFWGKI